MHSPVGAVAGVATLARAETGVATSARAETGVATSARAETGVATLARAVSGFATSPVQLLGLRLATHAAVVVFRYNIDILFDSDSTNYAHC